MLVVVIGASVGGTMLWVSQPGISAAGFSMSTPSADTPAPIPAPIFAELEPFTVTLQGGSRNHILYVAVTLRLADEQSRTIVREYMPEVRDRILKTLGNQNPDQVQSPEGRAHLVGALASVLEKPFSPQPIGPQIADVLFTAFVVQ
jgi:flagellar FliL protein